MKYLLSVCSFIVCLLFVNNAAYANDSEEIQITDVEYKTEPAELTEITIPKLNLRKARSITTQSTNVEKSETPVFTNWQGLLDEVDFSVTTNGRNSSKLKQIHDNSLGTNNFALFPGEYVSFVFTDKQEIGDIYYRARDGGATFQFYDENDILLSEIKNTHTSSHVNYRLSVQQSDVKKIVLIVMSGTSFAEIEFDRIEVFNPVEKIKTGFLKKSNHLDVELRWTNPIHIYLTDIEVNGESVGKINEYTLTNLEYDKEYQIEITTVYGAKNIRINTVFHLKTPKDYIAPGKVENLTAVQKGKGVLLSYEFPKDKDFSHVSIVRDGMVISGRLKDTSYLDNTVTPNKKYTYLLYAYDLSGNRSNPTQITVTVYSDEVMNLKANATAEKVTLSWDNTLDIEFEKAVIYRKEKTGIMARTFSFFSSDDGYTPIFTTNGTNFEDLTVMSDTSYTYKVTSMIAGDESDGVTIDVKTPKVSVGGGAITPDPNNPDNPTSYTVSWTSPTKGKLKVLIGGIEYKVVNAADLKIVIPAADMKFDKFDNYDVRLVPVDENGTEIGVPTNPGGGSTSWGGINLGGLGLDPKSLLTVVAALLGLVGLIILLAMSFRLTPKLIDLIKNSFR